MNLTSLTKCESGVAFFGLFEKFGKVTNKVHKKACEASIDPCNGSEPDGENVAPREYNYRTAADLDLMGGKDSFRGEQPGLSVFFRLDDNLFHAYSTYARGTESLTDVYDLLDTTPYGRQEDFEDSPPGWPQKKTYG